MSRRFLPLLAFAAACASATSPIPKAWMSVPEAPRFTTVALGEDGKLTPAANSTPETPLHVDKNRILNGEKVLTEPFLAIDSFAYSASRGEVVFSAKRKDNFDIGLVSSDGSPINWIPSADPMDEIGVQWAPRGNKVSYIVRGKFGDIVRTVHIPTSAHVATDFPGATIHALAWDPQAEHYAVAYSTPDASDRVEILKYDGSTRKIASPPAVTLDVELEPFAKDAIILRPRDISYDERLPLVVWVADNFAWSDARAALMKNARVAMIVTKQAPDEELWENVRETSWLDATHAYVVNDPQQPATSNQQPILQIVADARLPPNRYARGGNIVRVPPTVIQSFAASFIADHLKRTTPAHGRSQ